MAPHSSTPAWRISRCCFRHLDDRGWDGWMASPTQWTWVWVSSGSCGWTGRPGVLQSMGSQRVRHDCVTELKWMHCRAQGTLLNDMWQPGWERSLRDNGYMYTLHVHIHMAESLPCQPETIITLLISYFLGRWVMLDSVTPWTVAHQAPLSMEFPRQEYWSGLPFPPPGDLSNPGSNQVCYFCCVGIRVLYQWPGTTRRQVLSGNLWKGAQLDLSPVRPVLASDLHNWKGL